MDRRNGAVKRATGRQMMESFEQTYHNRTDLLNGCFTSVSFEYLVQVDKSPSFIPREIASCQFDIKQRKKRATFHAFITPRMIPRGLRADAVFQTTSRHNIPIEGVDSETSDYATILKRFYRTIEFQSNGDGLVLCMDEEFDVVQSGLDYLIDNCDSFKPDKMLYLGTVEDFFVTVCRFVQNVNNEGPMEESNDMKIAKELLSRSRYNHFAELCVLHRKLGTCHCSLGKADKIWLLFNDFLFEHMGILEQNGEAEAESECNVGSASQSERSEGTKSIKVENAFSTAPKLTVPERRKVNASLKNQSADGLASSSGAFKPAEPLSVAHIERRSAILGSNGAQVMPYHYFVVPPSVLGQKSSELSGIPPLTPLIKLPDAWKKSLEKPMNASSRIRTGFNQFSGPGRLGETGDGLQMPSYMDFTTVNENFFKGRGRATKLSRKI